MQNPKLCTKCICLAFIYAAIFLFGCAPDTEQNLPQEESVQQQPEKTTPAEDPKAASSETITIYAQLFNKHTKGPVKFTHDKHGKDYKITCNECHHVYNNGTNVWKEGMDVEKCEICHNEPTVKKEKTLPLDVQKKNLKLAFHNNCKACHRKIKNEKPASKAPTTCSGCHEKK
jgi:hypothetical protein